MFLRFGLRANHIDRDTLDDQTITNRLLLIDVSLHISHLPSRWQPQIGDTHSGANQGWILAPVNPHIDQLGILAKREGCGS